MGRFSKEPAKGDFEKAPAGTHVAVCFRIIDLGTQHEEYQGEEHVRSKVLISWELPGETMADGRPFAVSRFYTNSLHEKSALRKDLEAWRGRAFTEAELQGFDLAKVLGVPCLVAVTHTESGREKVTAVLALPKGTPAPKPSNPLQTFFLDEWDDAVWETIPKGIQAIIKASDEYKALKGPEDAPTSDWPPEHPDDDPDERPPF